MHLLDNHRHFCDIATIKLNAYDNVRAYKLNQLNMKIIKNSEELAKLVDENKDLRLEEDIRIEFEPAEEELRDVYCRNLYLENDERYWNFNSGDFNGRNFKGWNFNGRDFKGGNFNGNDFNGWNFNGENFNGNDFNGWNFNGGDFNSGNFNGWNFKGKNISYSAFFNCYGSIECESIESERNPHAEPVALDGGITITKPKSKKVKFRTSDGQVLEGELIE